MMMEVGRKEKEKKGKERRRSEKIITKTVRVIPIHCYRVSVISTKLIKHTSTDNSQLTKM